VRVVSWNLAYMKPGSFKTISNRQRQWALLAALAPDVALLQECRPDDLAQHAPAWTAQGYAVVGTLPHRWTACSAILARRDLSPAALEVASLPVSAQRWLAYLSGYVAAATVIVDGQEVRLASVHAIAKEVDADAVTPVDHEAVRRPLLAKAWHNDLAASALRPWVDGARFVVGGDWNNARLFDVVYPTGAEGAAGASADFFAIREQWGWSESLRKFQAEEVQTYLDSLSHPYELDHLFTDKVMDGRLIRCEVLNDTLVRELSDHAPVIAEFDI
jgi:exonuclease III